MLYFTILHILCYNFCSSGPRDTKDMRRDDEVFLHDAAQPALARTPRDVEGCESVSERIASSMRKDGVSSG